MKRSQKSLILGATPSRSPPSLQPIIVSVFLFSLTASSQDLPNLSLLAGREDDDDDEDNEVTTEFVTSIEFAVAARVSADKELETPSLSDLAFAAAASASAFLLAAVDAFAVAIACEACAAFAADLAAFFAFLADFTADETISLV